jgi:predicted site-specific integrase-resolvase
MRVALYARVSTSEARQDVELEVSALGQLTVHRAVPQIAKRGL